MVMEDDLGHSSVGSGAMRRGAERPSGEGR